MRCTTDRDPGVTGQSIVDPPSASQPAHPVAPRSQPVINFMTSPPENHAVPPRARTLGSPADPAGLKTADPNQSPRRGQTVSQQCNPCMPTIRSRCCERSAHRARPARIRMAEPLSTAFEKDRSRRIVPIARKDSMENHVRIQAIKSPGRGIRPIDPGGFGSRERIAQLWSEK